MGSTISKIISLTVLLTLAIVISVSAKTVNLAWDPSPDSSIAGYKVYYKAGSTSQPFNGSGATEGVSPINVGTALSTRLTNLSDEQIHYLAVTAYDASGNESAYSNVVTSAAVVVNTNQLRPLPRSPPKLSVPVPA